MWELLHRMWSIWKERSPYFFFLILRSSHFYTGRESAGSNGVAFCRVSRWWGRWSTNSSSGSCILEVNSARLTRGSVLTRSSKQMCSPLIDTPWLMILLDDDCDVWGKPCEVKTKLDEKPLMGWYCWFHVAPPDVIERNYGCDQFQPNNVVQSSAMASAQQKTHLPSLVWQRYFEFSSPKFILFTSIPFRMVAL